MDESIEAQALRIESEEKEYQERISSIKLLKGFDTALLAKSNSDNNLQIEKTALKHECINLDSTQNELNTIKNQSFIPEVQTTKKTSILALSLNHILQSINSALDGNSDDEEAEDESVKLPFLKLLLKRKFSNTLCCLLSQFSLRKQGWR